MRNTVCVIVIVFSDNSIPVRGDRKGEPNNYENSTSHRLKCAQEIVKLFSEGTINNAYFSLCSSRFLSYMDLFHKKLSGFSPDV